MISTTVLMLIAAGLAFFLAVLSILIGILGAQRGQRAVYYAMRRQAQQKASQRYVFAFWCVLLAGVLFTLSRILPSDVIVDEATPLQTAAPIVAANLPEATTTVQEVLLAAQTDLTQTQVQTAPVAASAPLTADVANPAPALPTPTLAVVAVVTQTEAAPATTAQTPTLPLTPTMASAPATAVTPTVQVTLTANAPADPATIVIGPNQQLALRAIGTGWDNSGALQGVSTEFPVGTKTIYVFFNFLDVPRGTLLRHTWLQDGKTVSFSSVTFNKLGRGTDAIAWAPKGGFQAGLYEVRVNLGNDPQFVANFLVR